MRRNSSYHYWVWRGFFLRFWKLREFVCTFQFSSTLWYRVNICIYKYVFYNKTGPKFEGINHLKGQSSEPIFWVECKNLFGIGSVLGTPNIFDFGLVFAEIFVFENRLPGIVYYRESMLCVLFTRQSRNSPSCLLQGVVRNNLFYSKSMTDLWKFAE